MSNGQAETDSLAVGGVTEAVERCEDLCVLLVCDARPSVDDTHQHGRADSLGIDPDGMGPWG